MILKNKSKMHIIVHNGKTFEKIEAGGVSSDMPEKVAQEQLQKFKGLGEALEVYVEKEKPLNKKAPKKGKDKKMEKLED